jgi:hypothetical protein
MKFRQTDRPENKTTQWEKKEIIFDLLSNSVTLAVGF